MRFFEPLPRGYWPPTFINRSPREFYHLRGKPRVPTPRGNWLAFLGILAAPQSVTMIGQHERHVAVTWSAAAPHAFLHVLRYTSTFNIVFGKSPEWHHAFLDGRIGTSHLRAGVAIEVEGSTSCIEWEIYCYDDQVISFPNSWQVVNEAWREYLACLHGCTAWQLWYSWL